MNIAKLSPFILATLHIIFMSQSYAVEKASGDTGPIHGKKPIGTAELEIIKNTENGEIPLVDSESQNTQTPEEGKLKILNADIDLLPKDKINDFTNYLPKINSSTIKVEDADLDGYNQNDEPANVNIEINNALAISAQVSKKETNNTLENTQPIVLEQQNTLYNSIKWYFKDRINPDSPVDVPITLPLFATLKDTYPAETISAYLPNGLPGRVWTGEKGEKLENKS